MSNDLLAALTALLIMGLTWIHGAWWTARRRDAHCRRCAIRREVTFSKMDENNR